VTRYRYGEGYIQLSEIEEAWRVMRPVTPLPAGVSYVTVLAQLAIENQAMLEQIVNLLRSNILKKGVVSSNGS
jgi:hypothetical protein